METFSQHNHKPIQAAWYHIKQNPKISQTQMLILD